MQKLAKQEIKEVAKNLLMAGADIDLVVNGTKLSREEVAEGWGLLYVYPDRSVEVVKLAELQDCDEEGRRRLALNVAASSFKNVLFANGVQLDEELNVSFNPPPRRRRKLL